LNLRDAPDSQVSLTDLDARSMATSGRGTGIVGYNVQTAVDTKHHLIIAHEEPLLPALNVERRHRPEVGLHGTLELVRRSGGGRLHC